MGLAAERRGGDDEGMRRLLRALAQDVQGNDAVALAVAGLGVAPGRTVALFAVRISLVIGAGMAINVAVTQDGHWWWSGVAAAITAAVIGGFVAAFASRWPCSDGGEDAGRLATHLGTWVMHFHGVWLFDAEGDFGRRACGFRPCWRSVWPPSRSAFWSW